MAEILCKSGMNVCWNFVGRSRNSDTKSSSPATSYIQLAGDGGAFFFLSAAVVVVLELDWDLGFVVLDLIGSKDLVLIDDLVELEDFFGGG